MKNHYDVIVVGAGPAGSMAARFAAEKGVSVLMLEKDRDVGYPVRCGEAVSKAGIEEFIPSDSKFIASVIDKFSMNAPDGTEVVLPLEEKGYILERRIFDYELAKSASAAGAEILTRAYVNGLLIEDDIVCGVKFEYRGEQHEIKSKVVIAADGVESRVGRWAGIKTYIDFRDMECCAQYTVSNIKIDPNSLYFYFGEEYAPEGYFWVFPKGDNSANIGLGVSGMTGRKRSAISFLNHFMEKNHPDASILTQIAGGVPCSPTLEKIAAQGIILVGDAARQVNPLSGGGIASGMIGGSIGGRIAGESVKMKKPDHLLSYQKAWNDRLGKRHIVFDKIKNGIYNFSDKKFNSIAHSFSKVPMEKRTLGNLFKTALINNPSLIIDVAKVFVVK
ncbi:MAG: NAD(P)/FAD-dependent oxidoreductase [Melioribacteraceae bacterium]|nr:NAD(P)/FAD-dependent oxidoreductase [Melioribacteraceae bacterium]MCF8356566.1 NAD(P)/FAD-dependent oxidoreductase [Melioribacteraceae bacterium]MCF8395926.1 NAD(P)/FAD-dependent oxidoreductase [Melioribacteraceae bacterium]MCF8421004.1 NAD(P)/FAD-dependent oxidoreductase [Melioribacteraceae bacterium]